MQKPPITKYRPFPPIDLPDRQWPNRTIDRAPVWCSVDLRDGNQALAIPMSVRDKLELFETLVKMGFKEIEVGFPAASQIEFDFIRCLIDENRIPDDVTIQVLTQSRDELIRRTFESIRGTPRAIVHLYNSTSPVQRRVVFALDKPDIVKIATTGAELIRQLAGNMPETEIVLEYSPESFSDTEIEFSVEICDAVCEVWQPTGDRKIILNLPATVEVATPNIHADQIEWFCRNLKWREKAIVSLHTHNDRGTGVAATELGLMAGADRVEGTLFGNGERTGNVDIVTIALNLYTQGVDCRLDLSNINEIRRVYERCTRLDVPLRHPYAGDLVFTAFSGSHQDAIKKGMAKMDPDPAALWQVPYLPIDPQDIGRNYRAIIRINSQSGKGGVAYVLEKEFGFQLPKEMQKELGKTINDLADRTGKELTVQEVYEAFLDEFVERTVPIRLVEFNARHSKTENGDKVVDCTATLDVESKELAIEGRGNGPIAAFVHGLEGQDLPRFEILNYSEHSLGQGADSRAVSYIQIQTNGRSLYGAGIDTNIELASIKAVISALNRASA